MPWNGSKQILRRVQQNDSTLTHLAVGGDYGYNSTDQYDYSRLGAAIAKNNHLKHLIVMFIALDLDNNRFFDGLEHNSSINSLELLCDDYYLAGWRFNETLMSYQANNNLITLKIESAGLDNGGDRVITTTLLACTNLRSITIKSCGITDEQLVPVVEAMRGIHSLEELDLNDNIISDNGCVVLSTTLLGDPSSELHSLYLQDNVIDAEGAHIIANSLAGNNKLLVLFLAGNAFEEMDTSVHTAFSEALCNTSSINSIMFSSNHTLQNLGLTERGRYDPCGFPNFDEGLMGRLDDFLLWNRATTNKRSAAIKKVVNLYPTIDMEPLYDWDINGEWTLKSLPYVIDWFDRALVAVGDWSISVHEDDHELPEKKLSAIYEFAKAMPLLFVPTSHEVGDKKRKR